MSQKPSLEKYKLLFAENIYEKDSDRLELINKIEEQIIKKTFLTKQLISILINTKINDETISKIQECIDYYRNNPNENYLSSNLSQINDPPESALIPEILPAVDISNAPDLNLDEPTINKITYEEQQPFKQELSRQDLAQIAKVAELVLTLSNDVNKLTKYNENYHQKISYKFSELEDRINNVENVEKHIVTLHESMNGLQTILPTSTIEIINNLKSAKSEFKTLSNTISGEISILNNELVKRVQDFNISIIDELSKVQRKNKEMADTIAIEVMNEAAKHIKHVNDEYINKAVQKNRNILIYGLAGSLIFSIITGAFVGKIVGNQAATATTEYIQSKFDAAAQQHQQEQLDQLKSQANKRKRQG